VANFDDPYLVKLVQLDEACRQQQVNERHFPDMAAVPQYAFSLTIPALCSAKKMLCVAPEKRKAKAVRDALQGPISDCLPGFLVAEAAARDTLPGSGFSSLAPGLRQLNWLEH
jgi:glucosamine-6-phosphate deaminase